MTEMLLKWVLSSSVLIAVVMALRQAFGKRISARLRYALWLAALVRLRRPETWKPSSLRKARRSRQSLRPVRKPPPSPGSLWIGWRWLTGSGWRAALRFF